MKIIAESSSTRTEWAIVEGEKIIRHAITSGLNPFFQTRREISHSIRLELPEEFFKKRWKHIYYYGAGCATPEKCKILESSLVAQFRSPATVDSDLLGAARGLLVRKPGLACILGTGSNSCVYDGEHITQHVSSLGYLLGDEGSGCHIGKLFISDCLKGLAPEKITEEFFRAYDINPDALMNQIYSSTLAPLQLSDYSRFLENYVDDPYVHQLIYSAFTDFFRRNIASYDLSSVEIFNIVGKTACRFEHILHEAAKDFGIKIDNVIESSLNGLIEFHKND